MTSTARAALPQTVLRQTLQEVQDLAGRCAPPADLTVHELNGAPLPADPGAAGSRRAVVVRGVTEAEQADPVVHVLLGPRGRVSGVSIRLSDSLEVWPL